MNEMAKINSTSLLFLLVSHVSWRARGVSLRIVYEIPRYDSISIPFSSMSTASG